jgi:hypothetical protein
MADEYIYRVVRKRPNPGYYKSALQTGLHSKRSLSGIIKHCREKLEHYERYKDRYNLTEPGEQIVKVERARLVDWTDVTQEVLDEIALEES